MMIAAIPMMMTVWTLGSSFLVSFTTSSYLWVPLSCSYYARQHRLGFGVRSSHSWVAPESRTDPYCVRPKNPKYCHHASRRAVTGRLFLSNHAEEAEPPIQEEEEEIKYSVLDHSDDDDHLGPPMHHPGPDGSETRGVAPQKVAEAASTTTTTTTTTPPEEILLLSTLRQWRVKELQQELSRRNISWAGALEKEDLVQRLGAHLIQSGHSLDPRVARSDAMVPDTRTAPQQIITTSPEHMATAWHVPLYWTPMEGPVRVGSPQRRSTDRDMVMIEPDSIAPFPTLCIQGWNHDETAATSSSSSSSSSTAGFNLNLLLDTACSGFVLRPRVVQKHGMPQLSTPVTMTGAGGTAGNTGLSQLHRFRLPPVQDLNSSASAKSATAAASLPPPSLEPRHWGPLPVAVQEIGALPSSLDGIIGLSFLHQFSAMDMDLTQNYVSLYPRDRSPADLLNVRSDDQLATSAVMRLLPQWGIYTVPVWFGQRGPVQMVVDTGASSTVLSWKGVSDLGLSRQSPQIGRVPNPMGAVGSDHVAIELTHRLYVSSRLHLGSSLPGSAKANDAPALLPGISLAGEKARLAVDIGRIPILESLEAYGVGGILGCDVLLRSSFIRLTLQGAERRLSLYQQPQSSD